ncbi:MAG: hypothetical protein AAF725_27655 [Acidobacteriota bacterium]
MDETSAPIDPDEEWVQVAAFRDLPQAHIASGILESHGLTPRLLDEFTVGADWLISSAIGGVSVGVPVSQAEAAQELLSKSLGEADAPDIPEELVTPSGLADETSDAAYFERKGREKRVRAGLGIAFLLSPLFAVAASVGWAWRRVTGQDEPGESDSGSRT